MKREVELSILDELLRQLDEKKNVENVVRDECEKAMTMRHTKVYQTSL